MLLPPPHLYACGFAVSDVDLDPPAELPDFVWGTQRDREGEAAQGGDDAAGGVHSQHLSVAPCEQQWSDGSFRNICFRFQ